MKIYKKENGEEGGGGIYFPPDTDLSELLQDSAVTKLIIGTRTKIDFRGD